MTDAPSGARAPGVDVPVDPTLVPASQQYPTAGRRDDVPAYTDDAGDSSTGEKAKQVAGQSKQAAAQAASEVKDTAADQVQRVAAEAKTQARNVATDVRDRVSEQARTQNDKLVSSIRQTADQLDEMRGDRADSPAATVVSRVAEGGRQFADYLDRHGPDGVLQEVQDFARRRPGAFLATALAAGFVVGRLGKSVAKADPAAGSLKPRTDSFVASGSDLPDTGRGTTGSTYATGSTGYADAPDAPPYAAGTTITTEYASTGTGAPVVVEEEYVLENPETRR